MKFKVGDRVTMYGTGWNKHTYWDGDKGKVLAINMGPLKDLVDVTPDRWPNEVHHMHPKQLRRLVKVKRGIPIGNTQDHSWLAFYSHMVVQIDTLEVFEKFQVHGKQFKGSEQLQNVLAKIDGVILKIGHDMPRVERLEKLYSRAKKLSHSKVERDLDVATGLMWAIDNLRSIMNRKKCACDDDL